MRKLLSFIFVLTIIGLNAQEKGNIRGGANIGVVLPKSGGGLTADLDFRYNITDNFNVGINVGRAAMGKDIAFASDRQSYKLTASVNSSVLIISDYYFNNGRTNFAPFVGAGIGTYNITNVYMELQNGEKFHINGGLGRSLVPGCLLRTGFEITKFRCSIGYHFIPKTSMVDILNTNLGKTPNSYLNVNLGFYLGGGKWKK